MSHSDVVRARIDHDIKVEAAVVLAALGLSVSDALRMLLTRVAHEKALPVELLTPNPTTIAAMREAREGKLESVTLDQLQAEIDAED
jgi:DNA-damage-inducible protein J